MQGSYRQDFLLVLVPTQESNCFGQEFREIHAAWLAQGEGNQIDAEETEVSEGE